MTDAEQFVFTANLKRQILLDSVQGRAPTMVFGPACTDSTLENCLLTWGFFETIHSESYTHILRAIYPDPSGVVDSIAEVQEIADCAKSVSVAYDSMIETPSKENLYLALVAANALEALRFYVSFACTFNFGQRTLVEGSAKIVRYIARDETQHMALTQHIVKVLPKDDLDFIQIIPDLQTQAITIYKEAAEQEKVWAEYLFSNGPILGLSVNILHQYIDYLYQRRGAALGILNQKQVLNPLPWMDNWLSSAKVQVAPQETEVSSYLSATALANDLASFKPTL
jgi:ribonucleoside-diphosphate reductase beta chain